MEYNKIILAILNLFLLALAVTVGYALYNGIDCWHLYVIAAMVYVLKRVYIIDND